MMASKTPRCIVEGCNLAQHAKAKVCKKHMHCTQCECAVCTGKQRAQVITSRINLVTLAPAPWEN